MDQHCSNLINTTFNTIFGWFNVIHDEHYIYQSTFTEQAGEKTNHPLSVLIDKELIEYYKNPSHRFQLPLKPQGSVYQLNVWNALLVIPAGRTITYGDLANRLQSSPRAIGQACKRNPLALFIPCHRVVGKHSQGGYMGNKDALPYKINLLKHEADVKSDEAIEHDTLERRIV